MARTQKGFARSNNAQFIVVKDHNISRVNLGTIAIGLKVLTEPDYQPTTDFTIDIAP